MTCCFVECSLVFPERNSSDKDHPDDESLLGYEKDEDYHTYKCIFSFPRLYRALRRCKHWTCMKCMSKACQRCLCFTGLFIFLLICLVFLVLFVALPLTFKHSPSLQRSLIFHPVTAPSYQYNSIDQTYHQECRRKFSNEHIEVDDSIMLGVWNITCLNPGHGFKNQPRPNLLYFHHEDGDRRSYLPAYYSLSAIFNVTTFDYRSYGDSSVADLVENGFVNDSLSLYKWLRNHSRGDIYVLGDGVGAAIATHVVSKLKEENIVPTGLILFNPFTSLSDKIQDWFWPLGKIFGWMPWYDWMITKPLLENDLVFDVKKHITKVDCPILILSGSHFDLPEKLATVASDRDPSTQGTVSLRYTWWGPKDSWNDSFDFLWDFIEECVDFRNNKGKI